MVIKKFCILVLTSLLSNSIFADDCFVIGFHAPNTDIYNGPTFCQNVKLKDIIVYGPLQVKQSAITGNIAVSGPIQSSESQLGFIEIKKQWTSQKITLSHHSVVNGDITFDGKAGRVYLSKDSRINGRVVNGKIDTLR